MSKHRARSRASRVGVAMFATAGLAATAVMTMSSANASVATPPGKVVIPKNSNVTGRCALTVQSVDPNTGLVSVKLGAQAQPTQLSGYVTNVYTQTNCAIFDATGTVRLGGYNPNTNGPVLYASSVQLTLPYDGGFVLCGTSFVALNSGASSLTPQVCG